MRQIQVMVAFLVRLLSGKDGDEVTAPAETALSGELDSLILQNRICEAEDLLYEVADGENMDAFYAGLHFYLQLSRLSEYHLKSANFSQEEITEGIHLLCKRHGISEQVRSSLQ